MAGARRLCSRKSAPQISNINSFGNHGTIVLSLMRDRIKNNCITCCLNVWYLGVIKRCFDGHHSNSDRESIIHSISRNEREGLD